MNLLNNLFDVDNTELVRINKFYLKMMIIILIIILLLFCIKKDNYYTNNYSVIDGNLIILVEKEYVDRIKKQNRIVINDIETKYSINSITPEKNIDLLNISLDMTINNMNEGVYKIQLGKERLFDYIVRIIKK